MEKEKLLAFSIIIFSISLVISAALISSGIKSGDQNIGNAVQSISSSISQINSTVYNSRDEYSLVYKRRTYNLPTAAGYLGINEAQLIAITEDKASSIPYIKVGNDYVFFKDALDKWMETARIVVK